MTQSDIALDLGSETVSCSAEEVAVVFAALLREMRAAAPFIRAHERAALRTIMAHENAAVTVAEVFPDFARESADHVTLRKLRTAGFIRPAGRDLWDREQRVDVRPFARLAWDRLGEAAIFGDAPDGDAAVDEIDLALPDVNASDDAETIRMTKGKNKAAAWNDDDVLDFLNDSKDAVA